LAFVNRSCTIHRKTRWFAEIRQKIVQPGDVSMAESYYRSGQAAKQLGVSSHHIRRLCEAGEIAAELTHGQQWKIPASEVARLKKEGVPPIPQKIDREEDLEEPPERAGADVPKGLYAFPSQEVIEAAEEVKITENRLRKRRLEREVEETEDWFRERERQQAAEEAEERQQAEAACVEQNRREWLHGWTRYALDSLPAAVPREVQLEVHAGVQATLANIEFVGHPQPLTQRLVDAAVAKALHPWKRKKDIQRAIEWAMGRLPYELRSRSENAGLKQRAWEAAVAATGRLPEQASYSEMETAATQAVQPMIREYNHQDACQKILAWMHVSDASWDEQQEAKEAVQEALDALPIGATQKQLEQAKETALAPLVARIARRKEEERVKADQEIKRRAAEWRVTLELGHIDRYLQQEYEFDGGYLEMRREADRLRKVIEPALIKELIADTEMSSEDIRDRIEELIEKHI
jgi:excisionase family DNA binding protein